MGSSEQLPCQRGLTCYPFKVAIYDGIDAPLETVPDPGLKSAEAVEFVMAGKPGMVIGKVGEASQAQGE